VSATVALGVEWLAKPRLEARKERILRRYRAREDVWRALDSILFAAATMKNTGSQQDQIQAAVAGIAPAMLALEEAFREVMPFTRMRDVGLMASYVGMVRGTMQSDRSEPQKGALLFGYTPMIMDVLGGPGQGPLYWARRRYRARRAQEAQALMDS
jgi:hypothetical protein